MDKLIVKVACRRHDWTAALFDNKVGLSSHRLEISEQANVGVGELLRNGDLDFAECGLAGFLRARCGGASRRLRSTMTRIDWPQRLRGLRGRALRNSPRLRLATVRSRSMHPPGSENAEYRRKRVRMSAPEASDAGGDGTGSIDGGAGSSGIGSSPRSGSLAWNSCTYQNGTGPRTGVSVGVPGCDP